MGPFDFQIRTRVLFGEGRFEELGALARELGFRRTVVVADRGLVAAGYVARAVERLAKAGVQAFAFHDFEPNPDSVMVEAGRVFAAACRVDSIIGLGGGSSLDCAKGINFVHTNGGSMRDYWGYGKATRPMLPMIAVPTTAGTGSEAQCYSERIWAASPSSIRCSARRTPAPIRSRRTTASLTAWPLPHCYRTWCDGTTWRQANCTANSTRAILEIGWRGWRKWRTCPSGCGSMEFRERSCPLWPRKPPPSGPDSSIRDHSTPPEPWRFTNGRIESLQRFTALCVFS